MFELDCSTKTFRETGRTLPLWPELMCYLPPPYDALATSSLDTEGNGCKVQAVSCNTGEVLWEQHTELDPSGSFYHPQLKVLLVADSCLNRIVALNPRDGTILQAISLPREIGKPEDLGLWMDRLVVLSYDKSDDQYHINHFIVKNPQQLPGSEYRLCFLLLFVLYKYACTHPHPIDSFCRATLSADVTLFCWFPVLSEFCKLKHIIFKKLFHQLP